MSGLGKSKAVLLCHLPTGVARGWPHSCPVQSYS